MTRRITRRDSLALVSSLGLAGLLTRCGNPQTEAAPRLRSHVAPAPTAPAATSASTATTAATPARVAIPPIGLDDPVVALGLDQNGQIVPPNHTVQWYTGSAVPGTPGIAVIAGHVTSPKPDVFYRLSELAPGNTFTVTDRRGVAIAFRVTRVGRSTKEELTNDATAWGTTTDRTLVLVTCDLDSPVRDSHYEGNFIAWAIVDPSG